MSESTFLLSILTPYGHYFEGNVEFLEVHSEKYSLGILPNHAPLISTLIISKMIIRMNGKDFVYANGGGVIYVDKDKVTLILDSVERADEIDLTRAEESKRRAEERLKDLDKQNAIDINRAKLALARALNRINIASKD